MSLTKNFRILFLGAGFSIPAGLPSAAALWAEVHGRARARYGELFEADLKRYLDYRSACKGVPDHAPVDFEDFISYLDIEHYLWLRGSDTWSEAGNRTQLIIKFLIGQVLSEMTPARHELPDLYLRFAEGLEPDDYVLTFNYDCLLEKALDAVGKPYRLFPDRFESIGQYHNVVDSTQDEIVILKLHGSTDWFDRSSFERRAGERRKHPTLKGSPDDPIFAYPQKYDAVPLLEGPRNEDDPLRHIWRVRSAQTFYGEVSSWYPQTPVLLAPSSAKLVYARMFEQFWNGLGRAGGMNFGMAVIGYSLPVHDEYVRQALNSVIRNFQHVYRHEDLFGQRKQPLVLVDYRPTLESERDYRRQYRFVNWDDVSLHLEGFTEASLRDVFAPTRAT